jgi:predicted dienelactone hydrolase
MYNAGFTIFKLSGIPCALWYPSDTEAREATHGIYLFNMARKGKAAAGQFPLIVMSHGSGGTRFGHCKTAEFFAQQGFIVLVPEHPKNNFFDDSDVGSSQTYSERSGHLKSVLDGLLADENWKDHIDHDRISVFGFSLGGYTALTCVGAKPYVKGLRQHIRINREFDTTFSGYEVIVRDGYEEDYLPVTYDPRYKACISLAPVSGGLFPKESLKDITVPVQVFRAERDMILRHPFHATEIRDNLPNGCDFHITEKAGHFSYLSPVLEEHKETLGELANDVPGFDRQAEHDKMHQLMLTFLHKALSI